MDEKDIKLLEAIEKLIEVKKNTTDETLMEASKEELIKYMDLLEEIKSKINIMLGE